MAHMSRPWLKATIVSALVSAVIALGGSILFGGGRSYPPEIEWNRVYEMKYQEAQEYLEQRAKRMSGWETFLQGAGSLRYWEHLFYGWLTSFVVAMACCAALLWWLGATRAPSNPTVETDARKDSARGSP
jgi:hypothetical protein